MLVWPGRYSSASLPPSSVPRRRRNGSNPRWPASRRRSTRTRGFPQFSDSSSAKALPSCSMRSASLSSSSERSCGVVWPQVLKARPAARTAAATCFACLAHLDQGCAGGGIDDQFFGALRQRCSLPSMSRSWSEHASPGCSLFAAAGHLVRVAGEVEGAARIGRKVTAMTNTATTLVTGRWRGRTSSVNIQIGSVFAAPP